MSHAIKVRLPNRFDFNYHQTFSQECNSLLNDQACQSVELDFSQVQYLDSSALGMLVLLAKKNKGQGNKTLIIQGAQNTAKEILEMANLNKLYEFR